MMIKRYPMLKKKLMTVDQAQTKVSLVAWDDIIAVLNRKRKVIQKKMLKTEAAQKRLIARTKAFLKKTNQYAWGDLLPSDLAKRNWISNLACKSSVKKAKEYWNLKKKNDEMQKRVNAQLRTPIIMPMQQF